MGSIVSDSPEKRQKFDRPPETIPDGGKRSTSSELTMFGPKEAVETWVPGILELMR